MRILVFGDSIAQGFHDDVTGGWVNRLAQYAIKKTVESDHDYDTSVFNLGISGNNTDNLTERFSSETRVRLEGYEGAVIFAFGVNDSQYELSTNENKVAIAKYKTNIELCITEAKKYTNKIFINSLLPINESLLMPMPWKPTHGYKTEYVNQYDKQVREIANNTECFLIEVSDVFGKNLDSYLPDGIHPSAEGHRLIFERVKSVLESEGLL